MSIIGLSASDIVKLVQFSSRIYVAFKGTNDSSKAQVHDLVREFSTFHGCLVELKELMEAYGKPLPFSYPEFKETLTRCDELIKPYARELVDKKNKSVKKAVQTIRFIGKEKEIEGLRKQISAHCQALQMCLSFIQLRLQIETNTLNQRLLDSVSYRHQSIGGLPITNYDSSHLSPYNALPPPSEADQLYQEWLTFSHWLKNEEERLVGAERARTRLPYREMPMLTQRADDETISVLNRVRMEVQDALVIEQNRVKREKERRRNLPADDAMRREVQGMPQVPRTYTLNSDMSMYDSTATIRPSRPYSLTISPAGSPQIEPLSQDLGDWGNLPVSGSSSIRSTDTGLTTPQAYRSSLSGSEISTAGTTPDDMLHPIQPRPYAPSLASLNLGEAALKWAPLCHKVQVERVASKGAETKGAEIKEADTKECDVHWRYQEDGGISLRSLYTSTSSFLADGRPEAKTWITQHFPSTGPSIPLTTTYPDGYVSVGFARSTVGRLGKRYTNVTYTFSDPHAATKFQTLLYTNNGKINAKLLYERPVCISSNLHKNECRHTNLRLWSKRGEHTMAYTGVGQQQMADVLVLLYYTNNLEDSAHWVAEPHYAFEWLSESVLKESSTKLKLVFSKDTAKGTSAGSRLFSQRRRSSTKARSPIETPEETNLMSPGWRNPSGRNSQILSRTRTGSSALSASSGASISSPLAEDERVNRCGYSELKIEFQSKEDRKTFLKIWGAYTRPPDVG